MIDLQFLRYRKAYYDPTSIAIAGQVDAALWWSHTSDRVPVLQSCQVLLSLHGGLRQGRYALAQSVQRQVDVSHLCNMLILHIQPAFTNKLPWLIITLTQYLYINIFPIEKSLSQLLLNKIKMIPFRIWFKTLPRVPFFWSSEINQVELSPQWYFTAVCRQSLVLHKYLKYWVTSGRKLVHICFADRSVKFN